MPEDASEDSRPVYTSVALVKALFVGSMASTLVHLLYGKCAVKKFDPDYGKFWHALDGFRGITILDPQFTQTITRHVTHSVAIWNRLQNGLHAQSIQRLVVSQLYLVKTSTPCSPIPGLQSDSGYVWV
jgi:hypothetical protein